MWVLISDLGGGPVCYNVLLHQRSMFALLSNSRLAFVMAVAGFHSTPLLRSLGRALLVLQVASLPQGLSAIRYCIELHGIIANDYEV